MADVQSVDIEICDITWMFPREPQCAGQTQSLEGPLIQFISALFLSQPVF